MVFHLSRRALFAGAAGTTGALAAMAAGVATFDLKDLMRRTLTRLLGEFDMSEEDLAAFTKDFSRLIELDGETGLMLRTASFAGVSSILSTTGPHFSRNRFEGFDRTVLATFITTTNYLDIYKSGEGRVVYHGIEPPCVSPFAHFEFP